MLLTQKLAVTANQNSSKVAFRYLSKGTTYKEAYSYINRYSYFLQNEIGHNKNVAVYMTNCPHMAYTFFALVNTRNLCVFIDPSSPDPKFIDKIKELEIHAVIVSDDCVSKVKTLFKNNGVMIPVIQCESRRWGEYDTTYRLPVSVSAADSDVVTLFETSGMTGKPKIVPMTHTMLQQVCMVLRAVYRTSAIDNFFSFQASLTHPFYFIHGLLFPFMSGAGVVITDLLSPPELAAELLDAKATRIIMKAGAIEEWLNNFKNQNIKIPTLRSITPEYGVLEPRVEEVARGFNCKILNIYGSVETCFAVAGRQFEEPEPFDSVGQFLSGIKTRIVDENGDDVAPNKVQRGQLLVSGSQIATGYYKNKDATKMNMRGPWFFTGDYVEQDKKGVVRFLDRKDNICKVVTDYIVPQEVEKIVMTCPGVERAALLNVKDPLGKIQLTLVVAKKQGIELSGADLTDFCNAKLKERQRPKNVAFMQEMPVDSHGFINKYKLRFELGS